MNPGQDYYPWRTVEDIVEIGFHRSRVVMMNEVHSGDLRCIRTRRIGARILPIAHRQGARYLAMEALSQPFVEGVHQTRRFPASKTNEPEQEFGYLGQPEMQTFVQDALNLGWTLVSYEPEELAPSHLSYRQQNDWREEQQARNLINALNTFPDNAKFLVWCGNNHHTKALVPSKANEPAESWALMGYHFRELSRIDPFVIDQGLSVNMPGLRSPAKLRTQEWVKMITPHLTAFGGTAGYLEEEALPDFARCYGDDAYIISLDNEMV